MKIALVSWWYKEYTLALANALVKLVGLNLFIPEEFKAYVSQNKHPDLKILYFDKYRMRDPRNLISSMKLLQQIRNFRPDVTHFQDGHPWFSLIAYYFLNKKVVTTLHDPKQHLGEEKIHELFRDRIMRTISSRYIVHGKFLKSQLHETLGVDEMKIDIMPHGNMNMLFQKVNVKKNKSINILFFGRIWPYKGLDVLIKACNKLIEDGENIRVIIAGKGEDFSKYHSLINQKDKFVIHNRYIDNEEIPNLFTSADIIALPYIEASQSGVIPLAFAYKKPVVATKVGSIPEVISDNKNGLLVPPKDVRSLKNAIAKLVKDEKIRKKIGTAGYDYSTSELNWDKIAKNTVETYEKTIKA